MEEKKIFYPTDITIIITSFVFGVFSFLNTGKLKISFFGVHIDRELLYGFIFWGIIPLLLLFFRLTNSKKNRIIRFFRFFYAQGFYILFFNECILLSQLFYNNRSLDPLFAKLDFVIFHFQPSMTLYQPFNGVKWVTELFFFSYFFYYFLITSGWWFLFFRKREKEAQFGLWVVTTSFCILYIFYALFPVKGPKFYFNDLHRLWYSNFQGYYFTDLMIKVFAKARLGGAAFPSSHVAISLIALLLNRKLNKYLMPLYFPFTITLFISTVYIYAHYFIDVLGGIFFGILLYEYVPLIFRHYSRLNIWFSNLGYIPGNFKPASYLKK